MLSFSSASTLAILHTTLARHGTAAEIAFAGIEGWTARVTIYQHGSRLATRVSEHGYNPDEAVRACLNAVARYQESWGEPFAEADAAAFALRSRT